jgi:hypothetical protein
MLNNDLRLCQIQFVDLPRAIGKDCVFKANDRPCHDPMAQRKMPRAGENLSKNRKLTARTKKIRNSLVE